MYFHCTTETTIVRYYIRIRILFVSRITPCCPPATHQSCHARNSFQAVLQMAVMAIAKQMEKLRSLCAENSLVPRVSPPQSPMGDTLYSILRFLIVLGHHIISCYIVIILLYTFVPRVSTRPHYGKKKCFYITICYIKLYYLYSIIKYTEIRSL